MSRSGLGAPVARARSSASEASTREVRASDSLDRNKESLSGLSHLSRRVLRGEMTHETRDRDEATPQALAAPVVAVHVRRQNRTSRRRLWVAQSRCRDPGPSHGDARTCKGVCGAWIKHV